MTTRNLISLAQKRFKIVRFLKFFGLYPLRAYSADEWKREWEWEWEQEQERVEDLIYKILCASEKNNSVELIFFPMITVRGLTHALNISSAYVEIN
jgi:hypothetical protein